MNLSDQRGPIAATHERDITMSTRDGNQLLLSDIYRPTGIDTAPVLLRRTPYGNRNNDLAETFGDDRPQPATPTRAWGHRST